MELNFLLTLIPAVIAAIPGIIALFVQNKKDMYRLSLDENKQKIDNEIAVGEFTLKLMDRLDNDILTLNKKIGNLECERDTLENEIKKLENENRELKNKISRLEHKNNTGEQEK